MPIGMAVAAILAARQDVVRTSTHRRVSCGWLVVRRGLDDRPRSPTAGTSPEFGTISRQWRGTFGKLTAAAVQGAHVMHPAAAATCIGEPLGHSASLSPALAAQLTRCPRRATRSQGCQRLRRNSQDPLSPMAVPSTSRAPSSTTPSGTNQCLRHDGR